MTRYILSSHVNTLAGQPPFPCFLPDHNLCSHRICQHVPKWYFGRIWRYGFLQLPGALWPWSLWWRLQPVGRQDNHGQDVVRPEAGRACSHRFSPVHSWPDRVQRPPDVRPRHDATDAGQLQAGLDVAPGPQGRLRPVPSPRGLCGTGYQIIHGHQIGAT